MRYKWGIDLGGTKIEGVILDGELKDKPICRLRLPTEREKGYDHILSQIKDLINLMKENTGLKPEKIGMGTPGTLDPFSKRLKNSNTTCLNGKALDMDISQYTGIPFVLANDANCFALAETRMGVVQDLDFVPEVVFGVIMGTGVGGGVVVNGNIITGAHGIGGEWGHIHLIENGELCYCGKNGCTETVISGPALERYYFQNSGVKLSLKEISTRSEEGIDQIANDTIEHMLTYFGKGISYIVNVLDPDVVIFGGGVGNIQALSDRASEYLSPHIFNKVVRTTFLRPKLGDSAGVFGAALL